MTDRDRSDDPVTPPRPTPAPESIRVAIADDQALVRAGFVSLLSGADNITMVGEAADGAEAIELARRARPHVMLMDIRMPNLDGLLAERLIMSPLTAKAHVSRILTKLGARDRAQLVAYETGLAS